MRIDFRKSNNGAVVGQVLGELHAWGARAAVLRANELGYSFDDVSTPTLDEYRRLVANGQPEIANVLKNSDPDRFADETAAIALIEARKSSPWARGSIEGDQAARERAAMEQRRAPEARERFVLARAAELEEQWQAARRRGFLDQANAEFDRANPLNGTTKQENRA